MRRRLHDRAPDPQAGRISLRRHRRIGVGVGRACAPSQIEIAAQQKVQQIWLPSGDEIDIRRVEMIVEAGAMARIFALNNASRYGRYEIDVTMHEGADFALFGANIGGGNSTLEIVTAQAYRARRNVTSDDPQRARRQGDR